MGHKAGHCQGVGTRLGLGPDGAQAPPGPRLAECTGHARTSRRPGIVAVPTACCFGGLSWGSLNHRCPGADTQGQNATGDRRVDGVSLLPGVSVDIEYLAGMIFVRTMEPMFRSQWQRRPEVLFRSVVAGRPS